MELQKQEGGKKYKGKLDRAREEELLGGRKKAWDNLFALVRER
jgi:hypothetical protein